MRFREIWREAARNFGTGASRGLVSMLAFLAIAAMLGSITSRMVVEVTQDAAAFRDAGASVYRLDAPAAVDGNACDKLQKVDGISASGATRNASDIRFALLPDLPTPYFDATAGMINMLSVQPAIPEAGLLVDAELAASLGVEAVPDTTFLSGNRTSTQVAATFDHPDDGRDATLSGAALGLVEDRAPFDSCWALFWPPTENPLDVMGPLLTASASGSGTLVQWNPTLGRTIDPHAVFTALPLLEIAVAGALAIAALAYLGVRLRRLEAASALHAGVRRADLLAIAMTEALLWLVPACALSLGIITIAAMWNNRDPSFAAWIAGARTVGVAAAAWLLSTGIATAAVRETHLVKYFQQR